MSPVASDITLPAQRGPGLYYLSSEQADGTHTVTRIDRQPPEELRERALCRALLTHALALLDQTEGA